jgi:hypothetical protein
MITMKIKSNIELTLWEIVWSNGRTEQLIMNGQQLAGFKRRKGIKKQFLKRCSNRRRKSHMELFKERNSRTMEQAAKLR